VRVERRKKREPDVLPVKRARIAGSAVQPLQSGSKPDKRKSNLRGKGVSIPSAIFGSNTGAAETKRKQRNAKQPVAKRKKAAKKQLKKLGTTKRPGPCRTKTTGAPRKKKKAESQ